MLLLWSLRRAPSAGRERAGRVPHPEGTGSPRSTRTCAFGMLCPRSQGLWSHRLLWLCISVTGAKSDLREAPRKVKTPPFSGTFSWWTKTLLVICFLWCSKPHWPSDGAVGCSSSGDAHCGGVLHPLGRSLRHGLRWARATLCSAEPQDLSFPLLLSCSPTRCPCATPARMNTPNRDSSPLSSLNSRIGIPTPACRWLTR